MTIDFSPGIGESTMTGLICSADTSALGRSHCRRSCKRCESISTVRVLVVKVRGVVRPYVPAFVHPISYFVAGGARSLLDPGEARLRAVCAPFCSESRVHFPAAAACCGLLGGSIPSMGEPVARRVSSRIAALPQAWPTIDDDDGGDDARRHVNPTTHSPVGDLWLFGDPV